MKVLIVTNTYPPGDISGVGSLAEELLLGLGDRVEIRVLTRRIPVGTPGLFATGGPKILFPLLAAFHSWRHLREVDVVHVNESDGVLVSALVALLRRLGNRAPRLGATFQVSYKTEAREVRPVCANGKVVSRPSGSEQVFRLFRAPLLALAGRLTARLADRIAACSRFTALEIERDYGIAERDIEVIANGLRLEPALERPLTRADGPIVALFAGRLRTRKGVAVLLEALSRPAARTVTLRIAGDGEQLPALARQAAELGLCERVTFLGKLGRGELRAAYQAADLFVLPSTYEGFPVAILEAMAAGLPVVATAVAGVPEALAGGERGLLVPPEDADAIADAVGHLAADGALRSEMGGKARQAVEEHFSIARIGDAYLRFWQSLIRDSES